MTRARLEKLAFFLSALLLAWLYGFLTSTRGWFPNDHLVRAIDQARALVSPEGPEIFLHERVYERQGARTVRPNGLEPGLTLVTTAWERSGVLTPGLRLIDQEGSTLHQWWVDPAEVFPDPLSQLKDLRQFDIQGSYLFPGGDVLVNLEYAGSARLDACSRVLWRMQRGNHHSVARNDDGSFWIPAVTLEPRVESPAYPEGHPGLRGPVHQDLILRVSPDGTVLDSINVLDVIYRNDLESWIAKYNQLGNDDPIHLNDAEPLPDSLAAEYPIFEAGDLVVSFRHLSLVFVFDPESLEVRWWAPQELVAQHDADFIGDGWIGIFDNRDDGTLRGTMLGGSRIVAFQPHTDSAKVLFPTPASEPFFTRHRGKWELLEGGNMLLTEEGAGRVVEVDPEGRTLWDWVVEPYEGSQGPRVPGVSKGMRVQVTPEEIADWPCGRSAEALP